MKKILVAMSGGVDSSAAALLLKEQGYDCIGVTMRLHENGAVGPREEASCCTTRDIEDARAVAQTLGIPYYVVNFTADFERQVVRRFVEDYERGATPNPCVDCNRYLKFDALYRFGREQGCDGIATGHYAQILRNESTGLYELHAGAEPEKDQSYVLYSLTQQQLACTLLPLGGLRKSEVRALAERAGLVNADKKDSEDICFVPDGDYAAFLERYTGKSYAPGPFVYKDGTVLGEHRGIIRYTIGQRKGLGIASTAPLYVTAKDPASNTVVLGRNEDLFTDAFTLRDVNWLSGSTPESPAEGEICVRYHGKRSPAAVTPLPHGRAAVLLREPLRAATAGQSAVLYKDGAVLMGGKIE